MKLFLLFSHSLTPPQEEDARISLGVTDIRPLPADLQQLWSQVPPDLEELGSMASPIWDWLEHEAQVGDYVLVQGDFGLTYATVNKSIGLGLVPIYATTERKSTETTNAQGQVTKTLVFTHVRFRRYG
ncbi:MAG: CRISPR-associated protein Csx20 [Bacteroidia bacterium]|nr:CRISPR-associated protein Csx20 [Bacteroidia bacterium]